MTTIFHATCAEEVEILEHGGEFYLCGCGQRHAANQNSMVILDGEPWGFVCIFQELLSKIRFLEKKVVLLEQDLYAEEHTE